MSATIEPLLKQAPIPKAFILNEIKGMNESARKALEAHGCVPELLYDGWSCPMQSKEKVQQVITDYHLKCSIADRVVLDDPATLSKHEKRIKRLEVYALRLENEFYKADEKLLLDIIQYNRNLRPVDFLDPPVTEDKTNYQNQLEKDFHERLKKIYEKREKIKELRAQIQRVNETKELDGILVEPGKIYEAVDIAEKLLCKLQLGIYQRGGLLIRITKAKYVDNTQGIESTDSETILKKDGIQRSSNTLILSRVEDLYLGELLTRNAHWMKYDTRSNSNKSIDCPEKVAKLLIARKEWSLPLLRGVVQTPIMLYDGTLLQKPGFDLESGLYLDFDQKVFTPIAENPSKEDAIASLEKILFFLKGFPFEGEADQSVMISAILTALLRKTISTAPLHGFSAPKMGNGKSLLADIVGLITTGKANSVISQAESEQEEQKRLFALLLEGDPIVCYDNIEKPFGSAALCSVLTQQEWKGRILGSTQNASVPTNTTFLATGNNLTIVGDLTSRSILCKLDAKVERPDERSFQLDLRKYIPENRGEIVRAALTIVKGYDTAGRPHQDCKPYGRFEEWSDLIRSAIIWLGLADPCATRKDIEHADPVRQSLGCLLTAWYQTFGSKEMKTRDVIMLATETSADDGLLNALMEFAPDRNNAINSRSLGKRLASFKNRIEAGYRIETTRSYQGTDLWRVVKV